MSGSDERKIFGAQSGQNRSPEPPRGTGARMMRTDGIRHEPRSEMKPIQAVREEPLVDRPRIPLPRKVADMPAAGNVECDEAKKTSHTLSIHRGSEWIMRIPGRIWFALVVLTSPIRALVWVLDAIVSGTVVLIIATIYAWWSHMISDEVVAQFLGEIGQRGLSILGKSGVL